MNPPYKVSIQIYPESLRINNFVLELVHELELSELYKFIERTFQQIINKNWSSWIGKSQGMGVFAYAQGLKLSGIFGNVIITHLQIYTNPDQAPQNSLLDILNTQNNQQNNHQYNSDPQEDKNIEIEFDFIEELDKVSSQFMYRCKVNTLFSMAVKALYCFSSKIEGVAQLDCFLDGQKIQFNESTTFGSLNIVSDRIIIVKVRWNGGYFG